MTATPDVDWTAIEQRARRRDLIALPVLAAWFGSWAALTGGFIGFEGTAGWWAVTVYLVAYVVLVALQRSVPWMRDKAVLGYRVQHAVREHVDPGPGVRERTDVLARRQAGVRWVLWVSPLLLVAVLGSGRWERPWVAVPAALVFLACTAVGLRFLHRQFRDARRWVADPPGPERDVAPPTALDTWTSGRRLWLVGGGLFLLVVVVGLVAGLTT